MDLRTRMEEDKKTIESLRKEIRVLSGFDDDEGKDTPYTAELYKEWREAQIIEEYIRDNNPTEATINYLTKGV